MYIDAADPNVGFANWQGVTPSAATGAYDSYGSAGTTIVKCLQLGDYRSVPVVTRRRRSQMPARSDEEFAQAVNRRPGSHGAAGR